MKNITFAVALFAVSITAAVAAPAARADGALEPAALGSWEGTGASMTVRGAEASTFAVSLVRKDAGNGRIRMDGTVRLEGGKTLAIWEESVGGAGGGFRISSSLGNGGGRCFDNGMCQSYVERAGCLLVALMQQLRQAAQQQRVYGETCACKRGEQMAFAAK